jgi:hypothetical protein
MATTRSSSAPLLRGATARAGSPLRWVKPCGSASTQELPRKLLPTRAKAAQSRVHSHGFLKLGLGRPRWKRPAEGYDQMDILDAFGLLISLEEFSERPELLNTVRIRRQRPQ